jgi:hypothetical protein
MDEFKKLEWLIGQWEGVQGEGIYHEEWERICDSELKGKAYMIKKGEISNSESLRLHTDVQEIYYTADVSHNPQSISFKLTFLDERKAVFENPQHDFPQKITYEKKENHSLLATIEAVQNGKVNKVEFALKRISS